MDSNNMSIVQYLGDNSGYKCGYCKTSTSNYSHGMHTYSLTVTHYQALIDRGWRRSGTYCYKPTMDKTCCPSYTIKCDALNAKLSKSQKKVLKRMRNFLAYGNSKQQQQRDDLLQDVNMEGGGECIPEAAMQHMLQHTEHNLLSGDNIRTILQSGAHLPPTDERGEGGGGSSASGDGGEGVARAAAERNTTTTPSTVRPGTGADPSKPLCRKAKERRLERRQEKLARQLAQSSSFPAPSEADARTAAASGSGRAADGDRMSTSDSYGEKKSKNEPKSIEDYIYEQMPDSPAHTLELRLVNYDGDESRSVLGTTYKLFKRYQKTIHGDTDEECGFSSFHPFLIETPLRKYQTSSGPSSGYGSFHQQYWLDGDKLIAVAVIDILPSSVSSVYFYYDPEYSFLSLGTYSSLREIALVRELQRESPALRWYYMGFYIHSCPKMQYKSRYNPSYLLCPETYSWHSMQSAVTKLDLTKYSKLADDPNQQDDDARGIDTGDVLVIYDRRPMRYSALREARASDKHTESMLLQYCQMVGKTAAAQMLLYLP